LVTINANLRINPLKIVQMDCKKKVKLLYEFRYISHKLCKCMHKPLQNCFDLFVEKIKNIILCSFMQLVKNYANLCMNTFKFFLTIANEGGKQTIQRNWTRLTCSWPNNAYSRSETSIKISIYGAKNGVWVKSEPQIGELIKCKLAWELVRDWSDLNTTLTVATKTSSVARSLKLSNGSRWPSG